MGPLTRSPPANTPGNWSSGCRQRAIPPHSVACQVRPSSESANGNESKPKATMTQSASMTNSLPGRSRNDCRPVGSIGPGSVFGLRAIPVTCPVVAQYRYRRRAEHELAPSSRAHRNSCLPQGISDSSRRYTHTVSLAPYRIAARTQSIAVSPPPNTTTRLPRDSKAGNSKRKACFFLQEKRHGLDDAIKLGTRNLEGPCFAPVKQRNTALKSAGVASRKPLPTASRPRRKMTPHCLKQINPSLDDGLVHLECGHAIDQAGHPGPSQSRK